MEPYIGAIGIIGEAHRKIFHRLRLGFAAPSGHRVQGAQSQFETLNTPATRDLPLPAKGCREVPDPLSADAHSSDEHLCSVCRHRGTNANRPPLRPLAIVPALRQ
jgi:hypothetical protein